MGRKRWWRGGLELLVLYILHHSIRADGNIGCLFSKSLCNSRTESCYNDLAFGKCIPRFVDLEEEDLYEYDLDTEELEILRVQLLRLENDGYKWSHPYTQCIMQTSLYNLRHGLKQDLRICHHLKDGYRDAHLFKESNLLQKDIAQLLPMDAPYDDVGNEIYVSPSTQKEYLRLITQNETPLFVPYVERSQQPSYQIHRSGQFLEPYTQYEAVNDFSIPRRPMEKKFLVLRDTSDQLYEPVERNESYERDENDEITTFEDRANNEKIWQPEETSAAEGIFNDVATLEFLPHENFEREESVNQNIDVNPEDAYERIFAQKYKHPKRLSGSQFKEEEESYLNDVTEKDSSESSETLDYPQSVDEISDELERDKEDDPEKKEGIYTEGGFVRSSGYTKDDADLDKDGNPYRVLLDDDLNALLWRRELAGFKRRERLDVKKPGPLFSTNNYAFKTRSLPPEVDKNEGSLSKDEERDILLSPVVKKTLVDESETNVPPKTYKNVDLDHVYIEFQQEFHTWSKGEHVVKEVGRLLGLNPGTLRDIRVGRAEVTFKVGHNDKNYNAMDVLNSIGHIRRQLRDAVGVQVIRAGIGDKTKLPATLEVAQEPDMSNSFFGAIVAAGVAAAGAAAIVTLIIARRHAKSRAKLAGLATPDPEASKDYQDLCRARMQAKQPTEKAESPRITNLSRESESNNASSNRSSTSSWSEEPTLSNMDISTGHMVLSYMEDHLNNKDRLDQEWAALCAYEADPSSTEIAESLINSNYNRPGAALPYDHSRIVLNDLANANNSDYINASTITDHDPRNPAYIATQGPLPHTAADFWQLIWEQGSVVIVMLTRLTEEGHAMCHRYWPEEGSELYHIYEVHLVSEHFWCDDYLVRSFYLKNLRTGETRTVTQFHFLSWPENNVPHSTKALLEFRRKVNKSYRGRSCPIVVHCSDGAGRTGTYCLIDMVLNRMAKGAKEIDIAATLEHIRDQRPDMVATKQQFEFVLMGVAEEVHAILKALPVPPTEKSTESISSTSAKTNQ